MSCCLFDEVWRLAEHEVTDLICQMLCNVSSVFICSSTHTHTCIIKAVTCVVTAGYFTQISTLADVQENVMEYLHVLSRPKVIDQEHDMVWTEAYIDNTVSQ